MKNIFSLVLFILGFSYGYSQLSLSDSNLRHNLVDFVESKKAKIGFAIKDITTQEEVAMHNDRHYPMLSVVKFPLALAVLYLVDKGQLSLDQKILIQKSDLLPNTWSPLAAKYPNGNVELPLSEIIEYTVAQSDNNGNDILLRLIGGAQNVQSYMTYLGSDKMEISATEEEMHKSWDAQYKNWTIPTAMNNLLTKFYSENILSKSSFDFLWKILTETSTGKKRLKAGLPSGTILGHKTGTSDTNKEKITAAINDVGIFLLPNKRPIAISVFITDSKEKIKTNEKIIAGIAKIVWNHYEQHNFLPKEENTAH